MAENGGMAFDREDLKNMKALISSMTICLTGLESRLQKEIEMISAVKALADGALDVLRKYMEEPDPAPV